LEVRNMVLGYLKKQKKQNPPTILCS